MTSSRPSRVLETKDLDKAFGDHRVLDKINIHVERGELVSLLGLSGSGKTTLFNLIAGLLKPSSGKIYLDGKDTTGQTGHVAYMLQKDLLLPYKTILDNASLPLLLAGSSLQEARQKASPHFAEFGLEGTQKKYPSALSGGMRQRAALLRTYLCFKDLALLDEPFSALDTITKSAMHRWYLKMMEGLNLTTLFITHDIDEAILLSDRIYLLTGQPGRIEEEIIIDEPRPRPADFQLSPRFLDMKRKIIQRLDPSLQRELLK